MQGFFERTSCKGEKKNTNCRQCNKKFPTGWKLERRIKQVHNPNKISKKPGRKRTTEANVPTTTVNKGAKQGKKRTGGILRIHHKRGCNPECSPQNINFKVKIS